MGLESVEPRSNIFDKSSGLVDLFDLSAGKTHLIAGFEQRFWPQCDLRRAGTMNLELMNEFVDISTLIEELQCDVALIFC